MLLNRRQQGELPQSRYCCPDVGPTLAQITLLSVLLLLPEQTSVSRALLPFAGGNSLKSIEYDHNRDRRSRPTSTYILVIIKLAIAPL